MRANGTSPKHNPGMPPDSGGILRGGPLLGGVICPYVVSRVDRFAPPLTLVNLDTQAFRLWGVYRPAQLFFLNPQQRNSLSPVREQRDQASWRSLGAGVLNVVIS